MAKKKPIITKADVDTAWQLSIQAADLYERVGSERNRLNMLAAVDKAEEIQAEYDRQYEEWVKK